MRIPAEQWRGMTPEARRTAEGQAQSCLKDGETVMTCDLGGLWIRTAEDSAGVAAVLEVLRGLT